VISRVAASSSLAPYARSKALVEGPKRAIRALACRPDEPRLTIRIVSFNGKPVAYAQNYEVHT
jgi:hypothetical protein